MRLLSVFRGRAGRRLWWMAGGIAVLVCVGVGWLVLGHATTSLAVKVSTTAITFTTSEPADAENAGLFAPSQALALEVRGCLRMEPVGRQGEPVACVHEMVRLREVSLDTLALPRGTEVMLEVEDGRLHLRLRPPAGAVEKVSLILQSPGGAGKGIDTTVLPEGSWRVKMANVGLDLWMEQKRAHAVPDESDIGLVEGGRIFFEKAGSSALVGDGNEVVIAKTNAHLTLKESRLELDDVHSGRIRRLNLDWADGGFRSIQVLVTGRTPRLLVYSIYTDEPSNEALSPFDSFAQGKSTRSLVAVAGLAVSLGSLGSALAAIVSAMYSARTFKKEHGA